MPTERGLVARLRDEVQNDCEDCACVGEKKQFHCHRHKALLADADAYLAATAEEPSGVVPWRCFHCDDMFTDEHAARLHFGPDEGSQPACKIKAGAEGGLLGALRRAEADAGAAWKAIHEETTDAARAHYAQQDRHATQLRLVEEAGYERGLADGMALRESPAPPAARGRHHPDCQLYELGTEAERAEARAFPEYAAGHPFCDDHPDDMPPAPQRCWQCEVVRLEAALADAQAETRRACAEELRAEAMKLDAVLEGDSDTRCCNLTHQEGEE